MERERSHRLQAKIKREYEEYRDAFIKDKGEKLPRLIILERIHFEEDDGKPREQSIADRKSTMPMLANVLLRTLRVAPIRTRHLWTRVDRRFLVRAHDDRDAFGRMCEE